MNPSSIEILDLLKYAYFEVDIKGMMLYVNDSFLERSELTLEQVVGRHYRRFVNPAQVGDLFRTFNRIYETRDPERVLFSFVRHQSGGYRVAEGMIGPVMDGDEIKGFRGMLTDVTEQVEEKIRLESARQAATSELEIGKRIQSSFLPSDLHKVPGWNIDVRFQSAREVAGDFYDIFPVSNGKRIGFVVADVCDKGVGAAMYMAIFRTLLRAFASQNFSTNLTDAISTLGTQPSNEESSFLRKRTSLSTGALPLQNAVYLTNQYIARTHGDSNMFATVFFGVLNPLDGNLLYINAGHEPPMVLSQGKVINRLEPTGPAVGLLDTLSFEMKEINLEPGQSILVYTDGIVDARDASNLSFGEERLIEEVGHFTKSMSAAMEQVMQAVIGHIEDQEQFDDLTLLSLQRET